MLAVEAVPAPPLSLEPRNQPMGTALFPRIPSPTPQEKELLRKISLSRENSRQKIPPKAIKMTTITMTARAQTSCDVHQSYLETIRKPKKTVTWEEATNHRPPLRIDMEGPTPWSYSPHASKPLNETNSPMWSFGRRIASEKDRSVGGRTSWEKSWFQSAEPWTSKVDFNSDRAWPAPNTYKNKPALGPKQKTFHESPSYTFGYKTKVQIKKGASMPAPNIYNLDKSDKIVHKNAPAFSHSVRRQGTILWRGEGDGSPGPGSYNPGNCLVKKHQPAFSIRGVRRDKAHEFGPFATL